MKINIYCISDWDKHFDSAIQEYTKRLGKKVNIFKIKPHKNWNREQIIDKETDKIIEKITSNNNYNILLSLDWQTPDSQEFAKIIEKQLNINYIIWWPYWLNQEKIKRYINDKICFGKMTMPHWLAKLVLLEQIYRADMIRQNRNYHY